MAGYRRKSRGASGYQRSRSTGRRRAPQRRAVSSRRRQSQGARHTVRIVIEQPSASAVSRPEVGVMTRETKKRKF